MIRAVLCLALFVAVVSARSPPRAADGTFEKDHHSRVERRSANGQFTDKPNNANQPHNEDGKFGASGAHRIQTRRADGSYAKQGQWQFQYRDGKGRFGALAGQGKISYDLLLKKNVQTCRTVEKYE